MRQQKCSAPRGAVRTHTCTGGGPPKRAASLRQRAVQHRRTVGPVSSKRARGPARRDHQLVGARGGKGADEHGLRRRWPRSARAGAPPPARGRRAGCRPSCAWHTRRSARARGRVRRARSPARTARRRIAGRRGRPRPKVQRGRLGVGGHPLAPALHRLATCCGVSAPSEVTGSGALRSPRGLLGRARPEQVTVGLGRRLGRVGGRARWPARGHRRRRERHGHRPASSASAMIDRSPLSGSTRTSARRRALTRASPSRCARCRPPRTRGRARDSRRCSYSWRA